MVPKIVALALLWGMAVCAQDVIHFERDFPGAVPGRFEVRLEADGSATYTEDGEEPAEFDIGPAEAGMVFGLAEGLQRFSKPLASSRRVASTGRKKLRFESEGRIVGEAEFDYSEVRKAREVASWFVGLAETRQHLRELERALRFDPLGVNDALVKATDAIERDRLSAPQLLESVLSEISAQKRLLHLARARAEGLLERIRAKRSGER